MSGETLCCVETRFQSTIQGPMKNGKLKNNFPCINSEIQYLKLVYAAEVDSSQLAVRVEKRGQHCC
jgi:hypothetical protein